MYRRDCAKAMIKVDTAPDVSHELELEAKIRDKEDRLMVLLSPVESYILLLQRILIWELPYASAVVFVAVHILFWLSTSIRVYCLFGVTCMILVAIDLWVVHVMPKSPGNQSGNEPPSTSWTEVHPDLWGVPELCRFIAKLWVKGLLWLDMAIALRRENRPKFFVLSIIYLAVLAAFGAYVRGIWLAYFAVMGLMVWPCLKYHKLFDRFETVAQPFIRNMETKLKVKRTRTTKKAKRSRKSRKAAAPAAEAELRTDSSDDSDERNISDFVPPVNPAVMTTLTSALSSEVIWDDDEDDYNDLLAVPRVHPAHAGAQSRDFSDDDLLDDELTSLTRGLGSEMPSFNDVDGFSSGHFRDRVGDASLDPADFDLNDTIGQHAKTVDDIEDAITSQQSQVPAADESDSDAEVERLAEGLTFPEDSLVSAESSSAAGNFLGELLNQGQSTFSAALSSQAISGLVTGAASRLTALREAVRHVQLPPLAASSSSTAESDLLESEFEFLNEEDLDQHD